MDTWISGSILQQFGFKTLATC